jgi:hypothetical protein
VSKGRSNRGDDKGRLPPFVPLLKETLQTPAWRATSHGARSLYVALRGRVANDCRNNGRVFLPTRAACVETGSSSEQIVRWFEELQHYGFIVQMAAGHLGVEGQGKAPHWRLTELGARNADGNLDMPTRDFLRWPGVRFHRNRTTFEKRDPVAESRNTPLRKAETPAFRKAETQKPGSVAESRSIETPKVLRKAEAYLDNHLHVEERSGAKPARASEAPRTPHTDSDDNTLVPIADILATIRQQVEGGTRRAERGSKRRATS